VAVAWALTWRGVAPQSYLGNVGPPLGPLPPLGGPLLPRASWVTSNVNPSPITTTHDSLYFLSIVSLTSRAAACVQRARHDTPFAPRTALSDIVPSLGGAGCITS